MSKRDLYDTVLDRIWTSPDERRPAFKVEIWNPSRTTIQDVVLGDAQSPAYDITDWVQQVEYYENIVFENNDEAVAGSVRLRVLYDEDALPIPLTEHTLGDGTPVRVYQGDKHVRDGDWPVVFTGTIRGNPSVEKHVRKLDRAEPKAMVIIAFDRAEAYLNRVIVGRSYESGIDVGKACVETAIEQLNMLRREIGIGEQGYMFGHSKNQLVDIEALKGMYELLFPVGKKPKFDANGKLIAADTDLEKTPIRVYDDRALIESIFLDERLQSVNNSVSLLGLSNVLTSVEQKTQRLAIVNITSGYFERTVSDWVHLSDDQTRKAKDTYLRTIKEIGIGGDAEWQPYYQEDGISVFYGKIRANTGYLPELSTLLTAEWVALELLAWVISAESKGEASMIGILTKMAAVAAMTTILLTMMKIGRGKYEIWGKPYQQVFQQLKSIAQIHDLRTETVREIEFRNDLLYDIDYMDERAKELLKRELVKGHTYSIVMLDDPVIEVDDVIEIESRRYYVTSISKTLTRPATTQALMRLSCWRIA